MMLTVKDVAARLNVSVNCVYQLVNTGKLRCYRIGVGRGAIRVDESDVSGFLEKSCVERHQPAPVRERPARQEPFKHLRLQK